MPYYFIQPKWLINYFVTCSWNYSNAMLARWRVSCMYWSALAGIDGNNNVQAEAANAQATAPLGGVKENMNLDEDCSVDSARTGLPFFFLSVYFWNLVLLTAPDSNRARICRAGRCELRSSLKLRLIVNHPGCRIRWFWLLFASIREWLL